MRNRVIEIVEDFCKKEIERANKNYDKCSDYDHDELGFYSGMEIAYVTMLEFIFELENKSKKIYEQTWDEDIKW